jgi:hypothetical protein
VCLPWLSLPIALLTYDILSLLDMCYVIHEIGNDRKLNLLLHPQREDIQCHVTRDGLVGSGR